MPKLHHNQTVPGQQEHNDKVLLVYLLFAIAVAAVLIPGVILDLRVYQVAEVLALVVAVWGLLIGTRRKMAKRLTEATAPGPKQRLLFWGKEHRRCLKQAGDDGTTFLGWSNDRQPIYWTDEQRYAQTSLPGSTGAGKTTLIYNVLEQDIKRGRAVIFIDGKGSQGTMADLIEAATKAGRARDIRIIDPDHPEISDKYNPFFAPRGDVNQRAGIIFDSLPAAASSDPYFAALQRSSFMALTQLLSRKEEVQSFSSLYRAGQSPEIVQWLIDEVPEWIEKNPDAQRHIKEALEFAAMKLKRRYDEPNWTTLLDGLFNSLDPFVGSDVSEIVNATRDLVSVRDVMDQNLILLATINLNRSSELKAIGRMLMRDLQAQVGNRYRDEGGGNPGFVSVVLDEFGLFAHSAFSNLVNTARQAHVAMIFSFQSMVQLSGLLGDAFASDIAMASNNKLIMRLSDSQTVREFAATAGTEMVREVSSQVYRDGGSTGAGSYEDAGRGTSREVERPRIGESDLRRLPTGQMWAVLPESRLGAEPTLVHVPYPKRYGLRGEYMPGIPVSYLAERNKKLERKETKTTQQNKSKRRSRQ